MQNIFQQPNMNIHCPYCKALLFRGDSGANIQIPCRGKDGKKCNNFLEINFDGTKVCIKNIGEKSA